MTKRNSGRGDVLRIPIGATDRFKTQADDVRELMEWRQAKAEAERTAPARYEAYIRSLPPGQQRLERLIKRLEDKGSQSLVLEGLKLRLASLKDGSYKRSFADLYSSTVGRIGTSDG